MNMVWLKQLNSLSNLLYLKNKLSGRMDLNGIIQSILKDGVNSDKLRGFLEICIRISLSCLNNSKFKNEIYSYLNHSQEDIAVDLIGDLFKTESGRLICFEKYFSGINIAETESDILKAKLSAIIYNTVNQRISKLRSEFGEIYFSIEKAVNINISRHPERYRFYINGSHKYIYSVCPEKLIKNKDQCDENTLLSVLFEKKHKTFMIPEVMSSLFEFLNNQDEFNNSLEHNFMLTVITNFFKKRST